ncbi:MAG: DUF4145 domain-containing protein [Egibacteraceae bacterium]
MPADAPQVTLDGNTLDRIARLICGDDTSPRYRKGYELPKFFRGAGWDNVPGHDGYRKDWTLEQLLERKDEQDALRQVLLRLADPREYLDDGDDVRADVVQELNQLLAVEGYQVLYVGGRPQLVEREPMLRSPAAKAPLELAASLAQVVTDPAFAHQLQQRLDEAHTCWNCGAPTAAIIMLGSILEGLLYDVAKTRSRDGREPKDFLDPLIKQAVREGWIGRDIDDYAHTLREYRNLVHPRRQLVDNYTPDDDTARIAWNVVISALNDLALTVGT